MKKIFFVLISLLLLSFNTCDDNPVNGDDVKPGRRDYVWELDSLQKISPNDYSELWGTSMDNLWLATDSYDLDKNLLHFDGQKWSKVATIPNPVQAWSLFGINKKDAWIGGINADFWKFKGQTFQLFNQYPLPNFLITYVSDIWGDSPSNYFSCGSVLSEDQNHLYAYMMKFDSNEWKYIVMPGREESFIKIMGGKNLNSDLLILSYYDNRTGDDVYRLYRFHSGNFQLIFDNSGYPNDLPWFEKLGDELFICFNKKIYSLNNIQIKMIRDLSNTNIKHSKFFGRSLSDIFFTAEDDIAHYNGSDVETIYSFPNFKGIVKMVLFDNGIAILLTNRSSFCVLRGKLE